MALFFRSLTLCTVGFAGWVFCGHVHAIIGWNVPPPPSKPVPASSPTLAPTPRAAVSPAASANKAGQQEEKMAEKIAEKATSKVAEKIQSPPLAIKCTEKP